VIRVKVLFFGRLKEIVGRAEEHAELSDGARVDDLFARYHGRFPEMAKFRASAVASVNQEFALWNAPLANGDEVAFLPPVSGGEALAAPFLAEDLFQLVREPIDSASLAERVKAATDGAVVTFDGIVRNHSGGRATLYLEYEAYESMALAKMRDIGAQIHAKFSIHLMAMVHRLGHLEIGETSVMIAVSSAHRRAAFAACHFAIDTLKKTVPIWKKEFFTDGAVWAEGETPPLASPERSTESTS
jgi:molybdopterin synthase catalytic subunit